jgi:hypothetical protein
MWRVKNKNLSIIVIIVVISLFLEKLLASHAKDRALLFTLRRQRSHSTTHIAPHFGRASRFCFVIMTMLMMPMMMV